MYCLESDTYSKILKIMIGSIVPIMAYSDVDPTKHIFRDNPNKVRERKNPILAHIHILPIKAENSNIPYAEEKIV